MKKYLLLLAVISIARAGFSQTMFASIGAGNAANSIRIYLKPDATQASCVFSTLQFNVAIPSGTVPIPSLTVDSSAFAGVSWVVGAPYTEGSYINYNIYTGAAGFTLPITANVEFIAMRVSFHNGSAVPLPNRANLVCLPDGGVTGASNALFYCTGTMNSNGSNLFYARDVNVTVANGFSYSPVPFGQPGSPGTPGSPLGTFTSFARYGPAVALPIKFIDFTAVKRDKDALLSWTIANQDLTTHHYEVDRSFNGTDFTSVITVPADYSQGATATYKQFDANIAALRSSGIIYYRIKEVDLDGHFVYSEIRSLRLDSKSISINLYPNPALDYTNLILDLQDASTVAVNITDAAGKLVQQFSFPAFKGNNQKKIDLSKFASGTYMLKVNTGDLSQTISLVKQR